MKLPSNYRLTFVGTFKVSSWLLVTPSSCYCYSSELAPDTGLLEVPDDIIWRYVNLFDIFISLSSDEWEEDCCERVRNELVIVVKWKCEVSSREVKENSLVTIGDASGELSWVSRFSFSVNNVLRGAFSTLMTWSRRIYKHVGLRRERENFSICKRTVITSSCMMSMGVVIYRPHRKLRSSLTHKLTY